MQLPPPSHDIKGERIRTSGRETSFRLIHVQNRRDTERLKNGNEEEKNYKWRITWTVAYLFASELSALNLDPGRRLNPNRKTLCR